MYNGVRNRVKIHFDNHMCGVFLDQFGKDAKVVGPSEVVEQMKEVAKGFLENMGE